MKTTIKIALIAICYFAINITATAQSGKVYRPRTTAPATNIPVVVAVKDTAVTQINQPKLDALVQLATKQKPLPKQDPSRAIATGTIKNETDENIVFGEARAEYYLRILSVRENPDYDKNPGGLIGLKYISGWDGFPSPWSEPIRTGHEFVITKVNDKEWKYTLYNIELNHRRVIQINVNYVSRGDRGDQPQNIPMSRYVIENAYYAHRSYNNNSFDANFIYSVPTPTLNTAYTLPTIVIKNAPVQPN
jgi:hypothetical protein